MITLTKELQGENACTVCTPWHYDRLTKLFNQHASGSCPITLWSTLMLKSWQVNHLRCCFPDLQKKVHSDPKIRDYGGWWHWPGARGDFDCTENSRPSALLDISADHNLTPHKFDHFRSLPCYLYCTSLFCLLLKKMTAIYLLGNMYLDITWSTPWGSEMTNDQGRLMILYIIDYIIKVNRASSMLNLGPSKIADWKHFPLWSTDDALMRWCTNGALLLRITDLPDPTCCS